MSEIKLRGVFAPVTTPFDPVTGDADPVALRRNLRAWVEFPLSGFVLFGSTGEGLLLDEDERRTLLVAARELIGGDKLLLAGAGAESTRAATRLARTAAEEGADAVLVHPPAYYKPQMTPDALRDHFVAVADASPVPVVLYQVPPRFSGIELPSGLVGELARHGNIIGIKDSTGDLKSLAAYVQACRGECAVLVGSGAAFYGGLEAGATGGILAVSLLAPGECAEIFRRQTEEDAAGAGRFQERVGPLHQAVVGRFGVPGIKAALELLGLAGGDPRPPLKPLRPKDREQVVTAIEQAKLSSGVS